MGLQDPLARRSRLGLSAAALPGDSVAEAAAAGEALVPAAALEEPAACGFAPELVGSWGTAEAGGGETKVPPGMGHVEGQTSWCPTEGAPLP